MRGASGLVGLQVPYKNKEYILALDSDYHFESDFGSSTVPKREYFYSDYHFGSEFRASTMSCHSAIAPNAQSVCRTVARSYRFCKYAIIVPLLGLA